MASHPSAVTLNCSLYNSAITTPAMGGSASWSGTYTDGDTSQDTAVNVGTSPTSLHADIVGDGLVMVSNPATVNGVANTVTVSLFAMTQALGPLFPGMSVPIPISSGVIIKATVPSDTLNVGVTVIECDANS